MNFIIIKLITINQYQSKDKIERIGEHPIHYGNRYNTGNIFNVISSEVTVTWRILANSMDPERFKGSKPKLTQILPTAGP